MISHTTKDFWKLFDNLQKNIQKQAVEAYKTWKTNPNHPGLQFKTIQSAESIYSVRIGLGYRALGLKESNTMTWFWVGSHSAYDKLISKL